MSNLAVLIMSKRIPLDVHKNKDLVFIRSEPVGAMVRVGKDTLINDTPVALSRVVVESKPIVLLKDGYQPFFVKRLPDDYTEFVEGCQKLQSCECHKGENKDDFDRLYKKYVEIRTLLVHFHKRYSSGKKEKKLQKTQFVFTR